MYNNATYKKELTMLIKARTQLNKITDFQVENYEGSVDERLTHAKRWLEASISSLQELIGETE